MLSRAISPMTKTYSELMQLKSYTERLEYLSLLDRNVKSPRKYSMPFYQSKAWKQVREQMIFRDMTFDLGVIAHDIHDKVIVHHIDPITDDDIFNDDPKLYDPENLITTSLHSHNIIHYGVREEYHERQPEDILPTRRG